MKGKNLEGAVANSSHPRYAAPGEAEGDEQHRLEWMTPERRQRLLERVQNPTVIRIGLQAAIDSWNGKAGKP